MSNTKEYVHIITGDKHSVTCVESHFAPKECGYKLPDGTVLTEAEFKAEYQDTTTGKL